MPGLTVDRYDTILSVQVLSLGMERVKDVVFAALLDVLREMGEDIRGIYERNDVSIRLREGLEEGKGWYPIEGLPAPGKRRDGDRGKRRELSGGCGERTEDRLLPRPSITGRQWPALPQANGCWTALPTPAPSA